MTAVRTYAGGRNTVNSYSRTAISPALAASTIVDERIATGTLVSRVIAEEPIAVGTLAIETGERFWLVALSAVSPNFPQRFLAVVYRDGEYACSLGSAQREVLVARPSGKYERITETNPAVAVAIELVKTHRAARRQSNAATPQPAAAESGDTRYCPLYRTAASSTWKPFTENGRPVSFASEAEAQAYIAPVRTAETRIERIDHATPARLARAS